MRKWRKKKFAYETGRFLESRKLRYKNEAFSYEGLTGFTQLILVSVVVLGGASIATGSSLDLADLLVFLLYIGNFIDPILRFGADRPAVPAGLHRLRSFHGNPGDRA